MQCSQKGTIDSDVARRLAKLEDLRILDTPSETAFDEIVALAATICQAPIAAIALVCEHRQWFKARFGLDVAETPIAQSICRYTVESRAALEVRDIRSSPFIEIDIVREMGFRYYMGVPLEASDGTVFGALCVIDMVERPEGLTDEQRRSLEMLARQAVLQMELRQALAERGEQAVRQDQQMQSLAWLARHDPLTGLGNRAMLNEVLKDLNSHMPASLLLIDVDWLKHVNDRHGHPVGDALLKEVGSRILAAAGPGTIAMRTGGDEFALLVHGIAGIQVEPLAERLLNAVRDPCIIDGCSIYSSVTIGIASFPFDAADTAELRRRADLALYHAKENGRDGYALFEAGMLLDKSHRLEELATARTALANGWIVPYYQPKVDLLDGQIVGLEALLRLVEPGADVALPGTISAAFEDAELARRIGEQMLSQVLRDVRAWTASGTAFGRVAINVTAAELTDAHYAKRLLARVAQEQVAARMIEIEVLENTVLDVRADVVIANLHQLADAGMRVAFDDFGTGYAALAHLPHFPINVIKIDQSFVAALDNPKNAAVVRAVVSLASEIGIEAVAEGVESREQVLALLGLGCAIGQGFRFSRAVPASSIAAAIHSAPARFRLSGVPGPQLAVMEIMRRFAA